MGKFDRKDLTLTDLTSAIEAFAEKKWLEKADEGETGADVFDRFLDVPWSRKELEVGFQRALQTLEKHVQRANDLVRKLAPVHNEDPSFDTKTKELADASGIFRKGVEKYPAWLRDIQEASPFNKGVLRKRIRLAVHTRWAVQIKNAEFAQKFPLPDPNAREDSEPAPLATSSTSRTLDKAMDDLQHRFGSLNQRVHFEDEDPDAITAVPVQK